MCQFDTPIDRRNQNCAKWDARFIGAEPQELLPFWVADTDFKAPDCVNQALANCVEHGIYGYTLPPANCAQAAASWQQRRHGFQAEAEWAVFIAGIDAALVTAILALTQPGDKIVIQTPIYAPFFETIQQNGRVVVENPMQLADGRYEPDFEDFAQKAKGAKLWMFCNPQNPTSRGFTPEELRRFGDICIRENLYILSDEIHEDIVFDQRKHTPIATLSPALLQRTITCTSPSKTFSVAGLVASVVFIANAEIRAAFCAQKEKTCINTSILGLVAMEAAYCHGDAYADQVRVYLEGNRDFALEYIATHMSGIKAIVPEATFLLWLDCTDLGLEYSQLADFFTQAGVKLSLGDAYRPGKRVFARLNFGCSRIVLEQGLSRIATALAQRP